MITKADRERAAAILTLLRNWKEEADQLIILTENIEDIRTRAFAEGYSAGSALAPKPEPSFEFTKSALSSFQCNTMTSSEEQICKIIQTLLLELENQ